MQRSIRHARMHGACTILLKVLHSNRETQAQRETRSRKSEKRSKAKRTSKKRKSQVTFSEEDWQWQDEALEDAPQMAPEEDTQKQASQADTHAEQGASCQRNRRRRARKARSVRRCAATAYSSTINKCLR